MDEPRELNGREEFIKAMIHMLTTRPDAHAMLIVDNGGQGLETLQTCQSFIWLFGLLHSTEKMLDERYRTILNQESSGDTQKKRQQELVAALDFDDTRKN